MGPNPGASPRLGHDQRLAGIVHTSWSEIDTARQCLHKHHLKYREGWEARDPHPAGHLGTCWHSMLGELYMTGDPDAPGVDLVQMVDNAVVTREQGQLLAWMLDGYERMWGKGDTAWRGKVVLVEEELRVDLPDVGYGPLELVAVIDLVVEIMGRLWIVDHKTSARFPRKDSVYLADQWTLYCWVLKQHGYNVFGSVHNFARTERLKRHAEDLDQLSEADVLAELRERYCRIQIERTDLEIESVVADATVQAWQAKLGLPNNPRSPGEHCYRRCSFEEACIAGRKWGDNMETNVLLSRHIQSERRFNEYAT